MIRVRFFFLWILKKRTSIRNLKSPKKSKKNPVILKKRTSICHSKSKLKKGEGFSSKLSFPLPPEYLSVTTSSVNSHISLVSSKFSFPLPAEYLSVTTSSRNAQISLVWCSPPLQAKHLTQDIAWPFTSFCCLTLFSYKILPDHLLFFVAWPFCH